MFIRLIKNKKGQPSLSFHIYGYTRLFCHIVENVLYVFVFFQFVKQFLYRSFLFLIQFLNVIRNAFKLSTIDFKSVFFQIFLNGSIRLEITI